MCGITGKLYLDRERLIDFSTLQCMTDAIRHRGPDDEGFFVEKNVGLGFRRLSIIDLNTGHQPLSNHDGSVIIIFNGEIYNYQEQRELLLKKGYNFKTTTDTEVILHLYEEYGVDCLQYLRGMFSFAIWDRNRQQLFCARDRFGIKPFYYYLDKHQFVFGSEIKSVLCAGAIDKTISADAIDSYFAFGYITNNLSIYKNIKKLQPAHYLLLSFKNEISVRTERYWSVCFEPDYSISESHWEEEIDACFSEAVKLHMISDVPFGAFLSGGIDSSSVVAMMNRNSNAPVKTFSIGFRQNEFNELQYAKELADKYGCEYHEQIVEPESISLLPKLVHAYDEPFGDSSVIPTYYVSKMAREFVTVVLTGDGGDELFAGYNIYGYFNKINSSPFNFSNPYLNEKIWGNLHRLLPQHGRGKYASYFLSRNKKYFPAYLFIWNINERKRLIKYRGNNTVSGLTPEQYKIQLLKQGNVPDFISNLQFLDIQTYLADDILTKVDRASMMNSLEVRVPMLDHKFAELSFKIPSEYKLNRKEKKYIFKKAMRPLLPWNILNHSKQGFGAPLSSWFKEDLGSYVRDTLLSQNPLLSNYLDHNYIRRMFDTKNNQFNDGGSRVWSLLFFEEWLKQNRQ